MKTKFTVSLTLLFFLTFSIGYSPIEHIAKTNSQQQSDEEEAEAFAKRFIQRLNETDDFRSLIEEFYIKDFISHGKQYLRDLKVKPKDARRYGFV
jgi:hypothetical protein